MNHPILHVKKGAVIYDDNAQATVQPRPSERGEQQKPVRRKGERLRLRGGRAVLLIVLVLLLAALLILRVVPRSGARADLGGWHAFLQAKPVGEELLVGIAFSRRAGTPPGSASQQTDASASFYIPATGERLVVTGSLDGSRAVLRGTMRYSPDVKVLEADVRLGADTRRLFLNVHGP